MSGAKIIEGLSQAAAWTKATRGGTELPTEVDRLFLLQIRSGAVFQYKNDSSPARARCEAAGWVRWVGFSDENWHGWQITEAGRVVLDTRVHEPRS